MKGNLHRLFKFAGVGVVNTVVYYGCYLVLHTRLVYLVAHMIAFVIAMIGSYFLNCYVTFRTPPRWRTFLLFPLSNIANFVLTTVGLRIAVGTLKWNSVISPLIVALAAVPITYVVVHYIMLGRHNHQVVPDEPNTDPDAVPAGIPHP